jgi:hypothetical protein
MSAYLPPTEFFPTFNSKVFYNNIPITLELLKTKFLTYPIGQANLLLPKLLVTGTANFQTNILVNNQTAGNNTTLAANTAFVTNALLPIIPVTGVSSGTIYLVGILNPNTGNYPIKGDYFGDISFTPANNTLTSGIFGSDDGSITANGTSGKITGKGTSLTALNIPNGGATIGTGLSVPNGNITTGGTITATGIISSLNIQNNQVSSKLNYSSLIFGSTAIKAATTDLQMVNSTDARTPNINTIEMANVWINTGTLITNITSFSRTFVNPATYFYGIYNNLKQLVGVTALVTITTGDTTITTPLITPFTTSYTGYYWVAHLLTNVTTTTVAERITPGSTTGLNMISFPAPTSTTDLTICKYATINFPLNTFFPTTLPGGQSFITGPYAPILIVN